MKLKFFILFLTSAFILFSCSDDDEVLTDDITEEEDQETISKNLTINEWTLENMEVYYLWNEEIPTNTDLSLNPADYFYSLLYDYNAVTNPNGDRFSFISEDAAELTASLSGEALTTGMEFRLFYIESGSNEILAQVTYTYPESPADIAEIERGDLFTKVNGTTLTDQNYIDLLYGSSDFRITLVEEENGEFVEKGEEITLTSTVFQQNPIHLDTVLDIDGQKIAYLVYNQFIPAPNNSNGNEYDERLNQIFNDFKSEGATELVVDLRYNPGGYVSSATNLASLIAPGVTSNDIFYKDEYNDALQESVVESFGEDFLNGYFTELSGNMGSQLNRVFFLVTNASASASELVINGLSPYMEVNIVGEKTFGKNVGSITITDDEDEENNWALQPIIVKSYNSLSESDYSTGFIPDYEVSEGRDLPPFGDTSDPLLSTALAVIDGSARFAPSIDANAPVILENSAARKKVTLKSISSLGLIE